MNQLFFFTTIDAVIVFFTLLVTIYFLFYRKFKFHQANQTIAYFPSLSSSSPPSPIHHNWKHHVFPSFHGTDVRKSFLSHIMKEFRSKGINTFIDNNIERSKSIGPELVEAIRGSRIAVVLISKNYASSTWCMNELVEIMECRVKLGQIVMTIFYEVDPTDVKKQTGDFGKVFKRTCKGKSKEDIGRWRQALAEVATIAGEHSSNWNDEAGVIEKIAIDISNKLNIATLSRDFENLVGMETHMEKMGSLLRLDLDEVRIIGIWGPPGIGKSTIARVMFNQFSNSFQLSAIMVNISGGYPRTCLDEHSAQLQLQSQMLSQMLNHKDIVITHLGVAQERLRDKKVFLVLDDVDQLAQVDALAKETQWFGLGSRIIITTENLRVLKAQKINHIYKVAFPSDDEVLQIFCMNAFGQKYPKEGFEELAWQVTYHAGKLPLGLKIIGSYFRGMSEQEWKNALPRLRSYLDGKIESVLKFSYDALCDDEKDLFLHIACFFNLWRIEKVVGYLANSFEGVRQGIDVLAEKSLISMEDSYIIMHSLLVKMGREIVRKQSVHEPGQRQFLVNSRDICEVLIGDAAGSRSVIGIDFMVKEHELNISGRAFEAMSNLQFLKMEGYDTWHLPDGLRYLPPKLRLLHWDYFPLTCLPSNVNLEFIVEFRMSLSKLEKLWEGNKSLPNLMWMDLSHSKNLTELPNLSSATNLQQLYLNQCLSLVELPSSIGNATNLQELDLSGCPRLLKLPSSLGSATNLQKLDLGDCFSLVELHSSIENATSLRELNLSGCSSLVELPSSLGNATNLQELNLQECSSLLELPSSIGNATNLQKLNLEECSSLVELPSSIGNATNLEKLNLSGCSSLVKIPSSIGNAMTLRELNFRGCLSLVEVPTSIGNLHKLSCLILKGCSKLKILPINVNLISLDRLDLHSCSSLKKFPEISTNISYLDIRGTAIEEVPSSIRSWSRLKTLDM